MLVLSRKTSESIEIGDIVVTVSEIADSVVTLEITDGRTWSCRRGFDGRVYLRLGTIVVTVVELSVGVNGSRVKLGIEAARDVPVYRGELAIERRR